MQRACFLGSATPNGFATPFWAAHSDFYGYYLKGGPGTGKSTLMKKIAAEFASERVTVYHCASDPRSLDAVVLEERRVFIADATAPHEASTPLPFVTGELVDLGAVLRREPIAAHAAEIRALYAQNQAAHAQVRRGLSGIGAMEDTVSAAGSSALLREKLRGYAARLAKRMLPPKKDADGRILQRQCHALTPAGGITYLPEGCGAVLLHDPCRAAGEMLLTLLSEHAAARGYCAEITCSQTQTARPVTHLILPECGTALILAPEGTDPAVPQPAGVLRMQRFYDPAKLRGQRSLVRFCNKTAAELKQQTAAILADALRLHDELESYYIGALDLPALDRITADLCARMRETP